MKIDFGTEDIRWEMDWSQLKEDGTRLFPDKPEKEMMFEPEKALAHLLISERVFINNHWWKSAIKKNDLHRLPENPWPEDACETFGIFVNCNDVFAWACADAEEMTHDELESVYEHFEKDPVYGTVVWCIKKRQQMPQAPVYDDIQKAGIWDLDEIKKSWEK